MFITIISQAAIQCTKIMVKQNHEFMEHISCSTSSKKGSKKVVKKKVKKENK